MAKKRFSDSGIEAKEPVTDEVLTPQIPEVSDNEFTTASFSPPKVPEVSVPQPVAELLVLPRVGIEVFAQVSGMKFDQLAGFVRWAKNGKFSSRTIPEWKQALTDYNNRPV